MKEDRVPSENRDSTVDRLLMVIERFVFMCLDSLVSLFLIFF